MKKITYIISDIDKALAFEWVAMHLDNQQFDLDFILLNKGDAHLERFLKQNGFQVKRINLSPGWKMIFTFFPLWLTLLKTRPDIIHTHLRYASLLGITAGYFAGIKNRIHTRHHASSNHNYYPHAVRHDRWVSRLSTKIVSISDVVTDVLVNWENTPPEKIIKIPHGFDLNIFQNIAQLRIDGLRKKYLPANKTMVIGMISRYMKLKGVVYGIEAFESILKDNPNAYLILANAKGPDTNVIKHKLKDLPQDSYTEIEFEEDIAALYQLFDVFIHIPIDQHSEAYGQTYIEALASGIPSVFTLSGIACECIRDGENAWVVPYKDSTATKEAIIKILSNIERRNKLISNGKKTARQFELPIFIERLNALYLNAS